jgi:radical SAM protein with 4Fe4S-binding SPASM domain
MKQQTLEFWNYSPVKKPIYKDKFCAKPFNSLLIDEDGDVMLCQCPSHMPYAIGNIYQDSLQHIWNNSQASIVRQSVADGDFTYCSWQCSELGYLKNSPKILPPVLDFPSSIQINLDRSCNLKCPSCREQVIIEKNNDRIQAQIKLFDEIVSWAKQHPSRSLVINPVGSGDIFASHSGLKLLESLQDYPYHNLKLRIYTNGTLIKKNQKLLQKIKPLLDGFSISIDASTPETYSLVRGGSWQDLQDSLQILNDFSVRFSVNFVIQKNNYHEIEQFADLVNKFDCLRNIYYLNLDDWGHWTIKWWDDNNAFGPNKTSFNQALDLLDAVTKRYGKLITMSADLQRYLTKRSIDIS